MESLSSISSPLVLLLIVNNAVLGIVTSLFLKKLNSILKAFASAIELVLTAVLSVPLLGKREVCVLVVLHLTPHRHTPHPAHRGRPQAYLGGRGDVRPEPRSEPHSKGGKKSEHK